MRPFIRGDVNEFGLVCHVLCASVAAVARSLGPRGRAGGVVLVLGLGRDVDVSKARRVLRIHLTRLQLWCSPKLTCFDAHR